MADPVESSSSPETPALPSPAETPVRQRRALPLTALLIRLVAVLALAIAGYAAWQSWRVSGPAAMQAREREQREWNERLADSAAAAQSARNTVTSLERRIADLEGVNRSLREEVLGMGERARLMEDALARLADRRLAGAVLLRVNEAESLLRLGQARLELFRDTESAVTALRLADAELAALDDPLFAGVRQTIAAEIEALSSADVPDRALLARRLDRVAAALPKLRTGGAPDPALPVPVAPDAGWFDRAAAVLERYVRIRERDDDETAVLSPLHGEAMRTAVGVELALAKTALLRDEDEIARVALARTRTLLDDAFVDDAARRDALAALSQVDRAPLDVPLPKIGQALAELRNLRATRALAGRDDAGNDAVTLPAPAAPAMPDGGDDGTP